MFEEEMLTLQDILREYADVSDDEPLWDDENHRITGNDQEAMLKQIRKEMEEDEDFVLANEGEDFF